MTFAVDMASSVHLSLCVCLSTYLSGYLSFCLPINLFVWLSVYINYTPLLLVLWFIVFRFCIYLQVTGCSVWSICQSVKPKCNKALYSTQNIYPEPNRISPLKIMSNDFKHNTEGLDHRHHPPPQPSWFQTQTHDATFSKLAADASKHNQRPDDGSQPQSFHSIQSVESYPKIAQLPVSAASKNSRHELSLFFLSLSSGWCQHLRYPEWLMTAML